MKLDKDQVIPNILVDKSFKINKNNHIQIMKKLPIKPKKLIMKMKFQLFLKIKK